MAELGQAFSPYVAACTARKRPLSTAATPLPSRASPAGTHAPPERARRTSVSRARPARTVATTCLTWKRATTRTQKDVSSRCASGSNTVGAYCKGYGRSGRGNERRPSDPSVSYVIEPCSFPTSATACRILSPTLTVKGPGFARHVRGRDAEGSSRPWFPRQARWLGVCPCLDWVRRKERRCSRPRRGCGGPC
jgi:hypothetical protein